MKLCGKPSSNSVNKLLFETYEFLNSAVKQYLRLPTQSFYSLSDLLLRSIPSRVIHALWEVLDKPDALSDSDLLLFGQLSDQSGLAGRRMVDRHMDLLLQEEKRQHKEA